MKNNTSAKKPQEINELDNYIESEKQKAEILNFSRQPLKTIFKWRVPERIFEYKSRTWYVTVAAISMVVIIYSALTTNLLLIFTVISILLLLYSLNSIPPKIVEHELTNKGVYSYASLIVWKNIVAFWITKRGNQYLINFEIKENKSDATRRLILLVKEEDLGFIVNYLVQYVDYYNEEDLLFSFIGSFIEGEHQPLLNFISDNVVYTKDPKDSPYFLKK
jgi:hypothetical protein